LAERGADELLERDAELAAFADLAELARAGAGSLLLIQGPAGIGKTRLLEATVSMARADGLEVAAARAGELERDFPFGVVRQLFEPLVAAVPDRERSDLLAGAAGLGASVLGDLPPSDRPVLGSDVSYARLHGLYWLTSNLAARKPLVIAVDDAQWADQPSLRFLAYLARRIQGLPALIVVARRANEPASEAELFEEAETGSHARIVKPAPLSEHAVAHLVRGALASGAHDRFCSACRRASGGNPFFLRELLQALREAGVEGRAEEAAQVSEVAPETVARAVLRRLRRLPEDAGRLARAVAILGDGAEPRLAAQLAQVDELSAAEAADVLGRVGIFRTATSMEFSHPIVRAAVYAGMGAADRAREHAAAARLLTDQGADPDRVATQLLATEPSGEAWTVELLRNAAAASVARGAPDVALSYLERVLSEPLDRELRADVLLQLGMAEVEARPPPHGTEHLKQALALTEDHRKRARISLAIARGLFPLGDFPGAAEALEQPLSELGAADRDLTQQLEAQLLIACMAGLHTFPRVHRRLASLLEQALAGELDDPMLLTYVSTFATTVLEPAATGAELASKALAARRLAAGPDLITFSFVPLTLAFADRLEPAIQVVDEALVEARRTGSVALFAFGSAIRSHLAWRLGSVTVAEADARTALAVSGVRDAQFALPFVIMGLVDALVERGEVDEASKMITDNGIGGPLPELFHLNFVLESRGRLRLAQGRAQEALADLRECGRRTEAWAITNPGFIPWRSTTALALASLGDRGKAFELAMKEVDLGRRFGVPRELGIALRAAGLVKGGPDGTALLQEAVEVLESSPAALERARAQIDLGAALRRAGHRRDAREPLRKGLDLARRCGATALAERGHTELVATGARPRRAVLSGVDALTASERRVAGMAARGLSNREIAEALFVTEKTIEWHLHQAYGKLDIKSRTQLAGALEGAAESG
jgi:ATP/maltotriose-dependent transcriptional regulator MalT